jgi:hypothetical protein
MTSLRFLMNAIHERKDAAHEHNRLPVRPAISKLITMEFGI